MSRKCNGQPEKGKSPADGLPAMDANTQAVMAAIAARLWKLAEAKAQEDTERAASRIKAVWDSLGLKVSEGLAIAQHLADGKTPAQVPVEPSLVANRLDRLVDRAAGNNEVVP
jgi:hypothetical protein